MHKFSLQDKYFQLMKSGVKTIELRLMDEKRRLMKVGDIIEFSNSSNPNATVFCVKIVSLIPAKNFADLSGKINCIDAGFQTNDELLSAVKEFYSDEKQNKLGVVGIRVALI